MKRLLVVEDDDGERMSIEELIRHDDVAIDTVDTGEEALRCAARTATTTAWCSTCACPT